MARVLYVTLGYTVHDWRFLQALVGYGHALWCLPLSGDAMRPEVPPVPDGVTMLEPVVPQGARCGRWRMLRASSVLRRVIRDTRPDLVHAGPVHLGGFAAALAGHRPMLAMSWGWDVLHEARRCPISAAMTRFALQRADGAVCDCRTVEERLLAVAPGLQGRIARMPWGIDQGQFYPDVARAQAVRRSLGWEEATIFLHTRSLSSFYGAATLIAAARQTARAESKARFLLVGDGPLQARAEAEFVRDGMSDAVRVLGAVAPDQLPDYFRAADVYVSMARIDGTSISLLEAMASGLPVIVSDVPGNREWVTPSINGWLVRPGDSRALAAAFREAMADGAARAAMGRANAQVAAERADWSKNVQQLFTLYDQVLAR